MRHLAEEDFPGAEKIRVVLNNLSAHTAVASYESFSPEVARRLARRIEFVYTTPVHSSWLNMAEAEISASARQRLEDRRLPDVEALGREAKAWGRQRNRPGVRWSDASRPSTPASSSAASTHQRNSDEGLVWAQAL